MNTDPFEEHDDAGPREDEDGVEDEEMECGGRLFMEFARLLGPLPSSGMASADPLPALSCDVFCIGCVRCLADF